MPPLQNFDAMMKPPEPPKKSHVGLVIVILGVLACAGMAGAYYYLMILNAPKEEVMDFSASVPYEPANQNDATAPKFQLHQGFEGEALQQLNTSSEASTQDEAEKIQVLQQVQISNEPQPDDAEKLNTLRQLRSE